MPVALPLPQPFLLKKQKILASLASSSSPTYSDKSPKGSVDAEIIELIDTINGLDGYVTTSSCAGRISVFVEGGIEEDRSDSDGNDDEDDRGENDGRDEDERGQDLLLDDEAQLSHETGMTTTRRRLNKATARTETETETETKTRTRTKAGPGGKGHGNHWLLVSHSPLQLSSKQPQSNPHPYFHHEICHLQPSPQPPTPTPTPAATQPPSTSATTPTPRLIHLTFSPLILHVLCASLHHAKPLLAAAINAGFRESGVQSLKALDDRASGTSTDTTTGEGCYIHDNGAGVMVAIRTAGVAFESVIGYVEHSGTGDSQESEKYGHAERTRREIYRSVLPDKALAMLLHVANERFKWNTLRKERLRAELARMEVRAREQGGSGDWEDAAVRRARKKEEGRRKQLLVRGRECGTERVQRNVDDVLSDGLALEVPNQD